MSTIPDCRHIRMEGSQCGSPAMRGSDFCYFHHRNRLAHRRILTPTPDLTPAILHPMRADALGQAAPTEAALPAPAPPHTAPLDLPALEDRTAIQLAISLLVNALGRNQVDTRRAATLLYGLQVASANLNRIEDDTSEWTMVTEVVTDADGNELAPVSTSNPRTPPSPAPE